jgi:tRNA nucleotidyltransferase (CCA-adding enzyme)
MFQVAEQANRALKELETAGYEAYLVGGCVRDLLAGEVPHDYDLATNALPEAVKELFSFCRVAETGIQHGTVTVILDGLRIEITTYRQEGAYSDMRRPDSVIFVKSLEEDLKRRDFTINAMAWHPQKGLMDPFGGRRDFDAGIIRCVGDPDTRFQEDALRMLRAIRFASLLRFGLEPETEAALFRQKEGILRLSPERITAELDRAICGRAAGAMLLQYVEILAVAIPELFWIWAATQEELCQVQDTLTRTAVALDRTHSDRVIRWAVLLHNINQHACAVIDGEETVPEAWNAQMKGELADAVLRRLRFDKATRERIVTLVTVCDLPLQPDRKSVRRSLYQLTPEVFFEMLEVRRAETLGQTADYHGRQEEYDQLEATARKILEEEGYLTLHDLAVTGKDLMSQGYHGQEVGIRLAQILDAVLDGKVANEKEALLNFEEERRV